MDDLARTNWIHWSMVNMACVLKSLETCHSVYFSSHMLQSAMHLS